MKPHLKLHLDGSLSVIRTDGSRSNEQALALIKKHHGSMLAFAKRYCLSPSNVSVAFNAGYAVKSAGRIGHIRQVLGLPSRPTPLAMAVAASHAAKRHASKKVAA